MSPRELEGTKGLFNGVHPQGWIQLNRFIFPTTVEDVAEISAMQAMNKSGGKPVVHHLPPRLEYTSIEAAQEALEELKDKTVA